MSAADPWAFDIGPGAPEPPPRPVYEPFVGLPDLPALLTLRARRQFVAWGLRLNRNGDRWVKMPLDVRTGRGASVSDPATWCSYEEAVAYALVPENACSGIGYVLTAGDEIGGGDLDDVVDDAGDMEPWAAALLALRETYAERSPSGRGVRLFAIGKPDRAHVQKAARVEVYGSGRWLSLTGRHVVGTPLEIRPAPETFGRLVARVAEFRERAAAEAAQRREAEGRPIKEPKSRDPSRPPTYLDRVNVAAFANPEPWVSVLFGGFAVKAAAGGWRVASRHLLRDLDEDLSIHPGGIRDWGVADMGDPREGKRSPVDLVVEWAEAFGVMEAAPDLFGAAHWLCERLGVQPADVGWRAESSGAEHFDAGAAAASSADDDSGWPFRLALRGVERRVETTDRATGETTVEWRWLCSHLEVEAHTRDADGDEWGRLLVVRDRDGRLKSWAMPMALLAGEGVAYRERLLSLGLTMAPGKAAREALHEYVSTARPNASVRCVSRIGWHGRSFALPDGVVEAA